MKAEARAAITADAIESDSREDRADSSPDSRRREASHGERSVRRLEPGVVTDRSGTASAGRQSRTETASAGRQSWTETASAGRQSWTETASAGHQSWTETA